MKRELEPSKGSIGTFSLDRGERFSTGKLRGISESGSRIFEIIESGGGFRSGEIVNIGEQVDVAWEPVKQKGVIAWLKRLKH